MTTYGEYLKTKFVSWLTIIFSVLFFLSWWFAPEGQPVAEAAALVVAIGLLVLNPVLWLLLRKEEKKQEQ